MIEHPLNDLIIIGLFLLVLMIIVVTQLISENIESEDGDLK